MKVITPPFVIKRRNENMNVGEVIDRYNGCMETGCEPDGACEECEFNLPDDVWDACGIIVEYAAEE